MELSAQTKIGVLLRDFPFLKDYLVNRSPKFKLLDNPLTRTTVGRVANISQVAAIGGINMGVLLKEIAAEIKAKAPDVNVVIAEDTTSSPVIIEPDLRLEVLKDIIRDLHSGSDMENLKKRFSELIKDIDAAEIARMEQTLIGEGMPETEVKRLCDVHVGVFKESLQKKEVPTLPSGHPIHTFMRENREAEIIISEAEHLLACVSATPESQQFLAYQAGLADAVERLSKINLHYLRKENQLFPIFEEQGFSGPSSVMWALHDDIRGMFKAAKAQIADASLPEVIDTVKDLLKTVREMIYKEEHILYPTALDMLAETDWLRVRKGEEEIGYAWVTPGNEWRPQGENAVKTESGHPRGIDLDTGRLSLEQVNLVLTHLPVDLSFVNEDDEVLYYSQTKERIFPRSPGVIGRKVQNCHPAKSIDTVQRILDEFRAGKRDFAEFWIQMKGRFLHIRYFAVRDYNGAYKGCLEVSQDVTDIRKLQGQQRLLDWS